MNSIADLRALFWQMSANILTELVSDPDKFIRRSFPTEGAPDWKITDDIVFLNISLRDDQYGRQWDSVYRTENGTVFRNMKRTRIWDLDAKCYGPKAFNLATALHDGVFSQAAKDLINPQGVFLVPYMDRCIQANEIFAGRWWERWDVRLTFNEEYEITENVGHIDEVPISISNMKGRENKWP